MSLSWSASALPFLCTGKFLIAETEALVSQSVKIPSVTKTNYYYCITFLTFHNKLDLPQIDLMSVRVEELREESDLQGLRL